MAVLSSIVLSQDCCEVYFTSLAVAMPWWHLTRQYYRNREIAPLPNLTGWIRPCFSGSSLSDWKKAEKKQILSSFSRLKKCQARQKKSRISKSGFKKAKLAICCYCNLKWTFENLLPCYCCAIKTSSRTIRSQVSQPASAGKEPNMSELHHHYMTIVPWTWLLCSVSIPANKLSLQELNQLNGIKLLISGFSEIFGF